MLAGRHLAYERVTCTGHRPLVSRQVVTAVIGPRVRWCGWIVPGALVDKVTMTSMGKKPERITRNKLTSRNIEFPSFFYPGFSVIPYGITLKTRSRNLPVDLCVEEDGATVTQ